MIDPITDPIIVALVLGAIAGALAALLFVIDMLSKRINPKPPKSASFNPEDYNIYIYPKDKTREE